MTSLSSDGTQLWKRIAAILTGACVVLSGAAVWKLAQASGDTGQPEAAAAKPTPPAESSAAPREARGPAQIEVLPPYDRRETNVLLAQSGVAASGCDNAEQLIDGNSTEYRGSDGYASYNWKSGNEGPMLITLPRPTPLDRIRFKLWDGDDRHYQYVLSVSPDGKEWVTVKDARKEKARGWQEIEFEAQPVAAVRIQGTYNSANDNFHVVEVEGYSAGPPVPPREPAQGAGAVSPSSLLPGLWAEYFDGLGGYPNVEDKPHLARPEATVTFGHTPPPQKEEQLLEGWPFAGPCAAIFSGYLKIEKENLYTFYVASDDGAMLYIDGEPIVDNDGVHGFEEIWGQAQLAPGLHRIWIKYFNAGGAMGLDVYMKPRDEWKTPLPPSMLFHDPGEVTR